MPREVYWESKLTTDRSYIDHNSPADRYERSVVHSALWAAAGDAIGWITELARGEAGVKHRSGSSTISKTVGWQRLIGGRNGPKVDLPAGTYSDDTQLRLAVSRSIRGNGSFDVETFAKIELTVWPTYALGGGLGTKAAALNLSRRGVNWFSNFFERGSQKYINGGGNGAAMRVQPHVWVSKNRRKELMLNVLRDSLVTHGHPHGFCGAVFHALALSDTLMKGSIPEPNQWHEYAQSFSEIPDLISKDSQLAAFWRPAWENSNGRTLEDELRTTINEALADIETVKHHLNTTLVPNYHKILSVLGCLTQKYRGSGFKTSLASLALAHIFRNGSIEEALATSANELESDTDTIATMTGAILGVTAEHPPEWDIQDREYIIYEARRLARIALGTNQETFSYPDMGRWNPPTNQTASVGMFGEKLAIVGLGYLIPRGEEYRAGDAVWQWAKLPFGQSILAKRKIDLKYQIPTDQLPGQPIKPLIGAKAYLKPDTNKENNETLASTIKNQPVYPTSDDHNRHVTNNFRTSIDSLTDEVILSNFDDAIVGRALNQCIDTNNSIESAIAFAAIIAKAKLARQRRQR